MKIEYLNEEELQGMRDAGSLASDVLDYIYDYIKPKVTTNQLNELCHEFIVKNGGIPAPLNYKGFPKSICTSKNHVVCHGIPDDTPLKEGAILNIDITVILNGWHGDTSRMYGVGKISPLALRVSKAAYEAMWAGIKSIVIGGRLRTIGAEIFNFISKNYQQFSVVTDYCGHGIGRKFHTDPSVVNYHEPRIDTDLLTGMCFTIEPMINVGKSSTIVDKKDGWTVYTRDLSLSAQFEHTIGITKNGVEIFTLSKRNLHFPAQSTWDCIESLHSINGCDISLKY